MFYISTFIKILGYWLSYELIKKFQNKIIIMFYSKKAIKLMPKLKYRLLPGAKLINNAIKTINLCTLLWPSLS